MKTKFATVTGTRRQMENLCTSLESRARITANAAAALPRGPIRTNTLHLAREHGNAWRRARALVSPHLSPPR